MTHFFRYFIISVFIYFILPIKVAIALVLILYALGVRKAIGMIIVSWCFVYCFQYFYWPNPLPNKFNNQKIIAIGFIESPPIKKGRFTQFIFSVKSVEYAPEIKNLRFNLSDYKKGNDFSKGDWLKVIIKVKKFRDYLTPGSASFGKLQYAKGFSGRGYIVKVLKHKRAPPEILFTVRAFLLEKIHTLYDDNFSSALMNSLLIGDRGELSREDWRIFQLTGTSHLIAISGLHVGLIVLVFYLGTSLLWRYIPGLCLKISAHQAASMVALLGAFFYSLLSGFGIPTQRAFLMSLVFLSSAIFNRKTHVWHSYQLSLFLVLLINPFSIFFAGFYLSFFVVFILIWFSSKSKWNILQVQLKIWLLLMPISFYVFHYYSLTSIPANLIAIPLLSFIILPFGFLSVLSACLWEGFGVYIAKGITYCISFLNSYLSFLSKLEWLSINYVPRSITIILLVTFLIFYALNIKKLGTTTLTFILSVGLLFPYKTAVDDEKALVSVLDVGQGLSVFIQTKNHALLYDTGDRFSSGLDLGTLVVVPFLLQEGIYTLDTLVISHEDMDHRGGFESIIKKINVNSVIRNGKNGYQNCQISKRWHWDGLDFHFLVTQNASLKSQNNRSCVLVVENKFQRLLLPGDIEKETEKDLVKKYKGDLKSTVLISPHHGSKTSSSYSFLKAVSPRYVLISSGENNRYHFPHDVVLKRYQFLDIDVFNTIKHGMIQWKLNNDSHINRPYYRVKSG